MQNTFFNKDHCPNCGEKGPVGIINAIFIWPYGSWNCIHCGALIGVSLVSYFLYVFMCVGFILVFVIPIANMIEGFREGTRIIVILIGVIIIGVIPGFAAHRKVIKK